jgi:transcriptional regulator with XRE-family HTH domain
MSVDPTSSPLAYFGAELRRLRDKAGATQAALAQATSYSVPAVSAFETARRIPSAEFALIADRELNADGSLIRLQALVEKTSVLPWFRDRIDVEKAASEICEYDSYQLPGLLQTEKYMRTAIQVGRPALSPDDAERAVTLRLTRQEILQPDEQAPIDRPIGKRLWAICDESALRRMVGSPAVMAEALSHLADLARRPNVTIQIMPLIEGVTCAYGRAFSILKGNNDPLVYLDDLFGARYLRGRNEVSRFGLVFDHLRTGALTDDKSLELIQKMGMEYSNGIP